MHPPPLSSIHLHSALPSSTQLSATPSTLLERKYRMQLGNFPKFRPKNSTLSAFTKNWHTWYVRGAVSRSGLRFLKFSPQNSFLGKFGLKKSKLSVLPKNRYTWYLGKADSKSGVRFSKVLAKNPFLGKFGPK